MLITISLIQNGKVDILPVFVVAVLGGFSGDVIWYYLGYRNRDFIYKKFKKRDIAKTRLLFRKYGYGLVLSLRFLYGMRAVLPAIIGASGYNFKKYLLLDFLSSILWVSFYLLLGYYFFDWLSHYIKNIQYFIFFIAFFVILFLGVKLWKQH